MHDLDTVEFRAPRILIMQSLDSAEFGSLRIWIVQNLNCAEFGSAEIVYVFLITFFINNTGPLFAT